jgi:hypothetical protein
MEKHCGSGLFLKHWAESAVWKFALVTHKWPSMLHKLTEKHN